MLDKNFLEEYIERNNIPNNPRRCLVEYLQAEILEILYASKYGVHLSFLGGTCLRFAYGIERFSEDLDFDAIKPGLNYEELAKYLKKKLEDRGFLIDTRAKKTENIFIIFLKFSAVMQQMGLTELADQKIKIKFEVDPTPYKNIIFESKTISAYGKIFNIISNTLPTLFAQKIIALKMRPYQKGRDFYDLVWFLAQKNIEPNYAILQEKNIFGEKPACRQAGKQELIVELKKIISALDLKQAVKDVSPFLFHSEQAKWILNLPEFIDNLEK
ncbi:MAG: nucleotidyl transferase AbiEii/AbiGii toxin family protein [Candidatus Moraniibacteriota bacterium]